MHVCMILFLAAGKSLSDFGFELPSSESSVYLDSGGTMACMYVCIHVSVSIGHSVVYVCMYVCTYVYHSVCGKIKWSWEAAASGEEGKGQVYHRILLPDDFRCMYICMYVCIYLYVVYLYDM